ncbi:MAG: NAD-dependent epimerase/dehydratase family protein [Natrialbaceae archaeon]|nr:NAD-dependent epimerase/dehydratase family protein [Natrialbaceae archaeon]
MPWTIVEQSVLADDLPTDVDVVFHLAALSSYAMHEEDPTHGVRVNVEGFVNTVEQARADGCDTVVYASTSSIYGSRTEPSPEDMPVSVNTGYEASKLARERYAEYFSNHYDLSMAGMRFFSVYQGYGGAEEHKGEYANVIAQFADDIAKGEQPVLYGDGTQTRDFTHVDDIVRGPRLRGRGRSWTGSTILAPARPTVSTPSWKLINEELGNRRRRRRTWRIRFRSRCMCTIRVPIPSRLRREAGWEPEIRLRRGLRGCVRNICRFLGSI